MTVEVAQAAGEDARSGVQAILDWLSRESAWTIGDQTEMEIWPVILERAGSHSALAEVLSEWAAADPKPLVVLIDEIDALVGKTLISVLRQFRLGNRDRPRRFPQSVVLCGVRDVRDYRIRASTGEMVLGGSAFNINAESMRFGYFSQDEVRTLLSQHAEETVQIFTEGALSKVWHLARGQPWLVNALAYETCFRRKAASDRGRPVTTEHVHAARERLIPRQDTHLVQLAHKLREPRVLRVIEPLPSGGKVSPREDDIAYARDLGLLARHPPLAVANPIYRELIPRELTSDVQETITEDPKRSVSKGGRLLVSKLLEAFQRYFQENSEHWVERLRYKEAGPQLLLQGFLQTLVNSGARVAREYGLGRRRADLLIVWPKGAGVAQPHARRKVVIACKVLRRSLKTGDPLRYPFR